MKYTTLSTASAKSRGPRCPLRARLRRQSSLKQLQHQLDARLHRRQPPAEGSAPARCPTTAPRRRSACCAAPPRRRPAPAAAPLRARGAACRCRCRRRPCRAPGGAQRVDHRAARAGVAGHDLHPRPVARIARAARPAPSGLPRRPGAQQRSAPSSITASGPASPELERIDAVAVHLAHVGAAMHAPGQHATHAARAGAARHAPRHRAGSAARRPAARWPAASPPSAPPAWPAPARAAGSRRSPPACRCRA